MNVKDILRRKKPGDVYANAEIAGTDGVIYSGGGKKKLILLPMKSVTLDTFSFPFRSLAKIREALRLRAGGFMPGAGGDIAIFPALLSTSGVSGNGIVFYVSEAECVSSGISGEIWPAPIALVSGLEPYGGSGVTMWADGENVCSVLWQSYCPVTYRWCPFSANAEARERAWFDAYCQSQELERGGNFAVDMNDVDGSYIAETVRRSVDLCAWLNGLNLSRTVLEGARDMERKLSIIARVTMGLLGVGVIILGAEILRSHHLSSLTAEIRGRSEKYYRDTFDPERKGRISNPVTLAREKIGLLSGGGEDRHTLEGVLSDMGRVSAQNADITVDAVRYGREGIDCTGTAPDMMGVLRFRKTWEELGYEAEADNTQFVSGIGYRFDVGIRW